MSYHIIYLPTDDKPTRNPGSLDLFIWGAHMGGLCHSHLPGGLVPGPMLCGAAPDGGIGCAAQPSGFQ